MTENRPSDNNLTDERQRHEGWTTPGTTWDFLKPLTREKRSSQTKAESALWAEIRASKLGTKFRRQHPIGRHIVDFYCSVAKLAVELDGSAHDGNEEHDSARQQYLEDKYGLRFVRFTNEQVLRDIDAVIKELRRLLDQDQLGAR